MSVTFIERASGQGIAVTLRRTARRTRKTRATIISSPITCVPAAELTNPSALPPLHTTQSVPADSRSSPKAEVELKARAFMPSANGDGQANDTLLSRPPMPARASQRRGAIQWSSAGAGQAVYPSATSGTMPAHAGQSSNDTQAATAGAGRANAKAEPSSSLPALIGTIRELYAQRRAAIRMQLRIDNQCRALVRRGMGWRFDMPEKERAKVNADASAMVDAVQKGEAPAEHAELADALRPFCLVSLAARTPFDAMRSSIEKQLRTLARKLPVWPWAEALNGFGELGLATVVGEAGDLSNYANPAKVWKRFGLHVSDGKAARNTTGEVGHSAARRSASWVIADSLLRQDNPYQKLYRERRAYEIARNPDFDKGIDPKTGKQKATMHCDRRARRYAEKRFLRDLWRAWRDAK